MKKENVKAYKEKWGNDVYAKIGSRGGKKGHTGGFYGDPEKARQAALKGWANRRIKKDTASA